MSYRELLALAHDPRISSDTRRSPVFTQLGGQAQPDPVEAELAAEAEQLQAYGHDQSIIVSDPPDHDRARRLLMRYFGPPHSPDLIPGMETDIQRLPAGRLRPQTTFVLARGGHALAIASPPGTKRASYRASTSTSTVPDEWLKDSADNPGSWWENWHVWIEKRAPASKPAPRALGSDTYPPLAAAVGDCVRRRLT